MSNYEELFRFTGRPIRQLLPALPLDECMFVKGYVLSYDELATEQNVQAADGQEAVRGN